MDTNFAGIGYVHTESDIFFNPTTQIEDAQMDLNVVAAKYIRAFELFNKSARIELAQGYAEGRWTGLLEGAPAKATRKGFSDTLARFAINLIGAPPLKGKEFGAYRASKKVDTIVGVGLAIRLPTGEYFEERLINLGQNRFVFMPQVGIEHRRGKWTFEWTSRLSIFEDNDEFFGGSTLERDPLFFTHGHVVYNFKPGLWVSGSVGYNYGGENTVDGNTRNDTQQNIGWAFKAGIPINRYSGISLGYIHSETQESVGRDNDIFSAGYSFTWD